ncbi:MAG: YihA family ribosome biogenesis GTP-binding protein [Gemmatimonadetes bacterium]|nr:YihA family ribosome biogenesis GTP-binding protein [Gemmatimonadota bacterium]
MKGVVRLEDLPSQRIPEIATSGRSNVGKSSLLNSVFGRKGLAKVSSTPGKTREINFFNIADRYHLVDLPGYGYARVPTAVKEKWGRLVKEYLEQRDQLAGVIQLIDSRHDPTAQDREMLAWLHEAGLPTLVVGTKTDKLKKSQAAADLRRLEKAAGGFPVVGFSTLKKQGRGPILQWIDGAVSDWTARPRSRGGV